jgi:hypothetical protein
VAKKNTRKKKNKTTNVYADGAEDIAAAFNVGSDSDDVHEKKGSKKKHNKKEKGDKKHKKEEEEEKQTKKEDKHKDKPKKEQKVV